MITSETCLLDTNILVYAADEASPFHQDAKKLRKKGMNGEASFCICPQVLSEYFAIITDPKRVNEPRTQKEAVLEIEKYFASINILKIYPGHDVMEKVLYLLKRYKITKQEIFDLQLVATMLSNNVTNIYTLNQSDFLKFEEIVVLTL